MRNMTAAAVNSNGTKELAITGDGLTAVAEHERGKRLKVLLSAYSCIPNFGSEPGVGWNNVKEISKLHDVWVLTMSEFRETIEAELEQNPMPNVHWSFVEIPKILLTGWKKGERGRRIHYMLWQIWAYRAAKRLHEQVQFDIAHHVTFVSYWTPDYVSLLNIPFVWGPVGGGDSTPLPYYPTLSWKSRITELIRDTFRFTSERLDPYVGKTARHAAIGLATTEATADKMRKLGAVDVRIMSECALTSETISALQEQSVDYDKRPFRVVSVGRLIGWKGYHLGIEAFARMHQQVPDSEYWIIGTGTELESLKSLTAKLGAESYIHFTGFLPREDVLQKMSAAHVLLHPSLHDTGSWVCLEAMAAGLPVVCLRLGGPATIVNDETGIRVSGAGPHQSIDEIASALARLGQDPTLCRQMGEAARRRVNEHFSWMHTGDTFDRIYSELVKAR